MNRLAKRLTAILMPAAMAVSAGFLFGCNSHTHTVEFVAGKQPTCSEQGIVEHWHCSDCGKNFKDPGAQTAVSNIYISQVPHSYILGYGFNEEQHYKQCADCDYIDILNAVDHLLSYNGDDADHWWHCYCDYESAHVAHTPNDGSAPCTLCGYGGIQYQLSGDGKYYICTGVSSSYVQKIEELVVPDEYNGLPVKEIAERAFQHCTSLKSVSMGKNVVSIGSYAFFECSSLTDITLNRGLIEIDAYAFIDCAALEQIELPTTLRNMRVGAFQSCRSLKRIVIPASVTEIPRQVFFNCNSLEEVVLHDKIKSIDTAAFSGTAITNLVLEGNLTEIPMTMCLSCSVLKSVTIPATVTKFNAAAFSGCSALETINFLGTQAQWDAIEFINVPQAWDYATPKYTVVCK